MRLAKRLIFQFSRRESVLFGFAIVALAVTYFLVARFGISLGFYQKHISAIWPATGLGIAVILRFGYSLWPGLFLGVTLVNISLGITPAVSLLIAFATTLEAVVARYFLFELFDFKKTFARLQDVLLLILGACLLAVAIGKTVELTVLCFNQTVPWSDFIFLWREWWFGDIAGVLTVTPFILAWTSGKSFRMTTRKFLEAIIVGSFFIFVSNLIFSSDQFFGSLIPLYAIYPFLIWISIRFGMRGASLALITLAFIATKGTVEGFGPFGVDSLLPGVLSLQLFLGVSAITALVLAASTIEHRDVQEDYNHILERFKLIADSSKDAIGYAALDGTLIDVNNAYLKLIGYSYDELFEKHTKYQELTPKEYHLTESKKIEELIKVGKPVEYEKEYLHKDGRRIPVLVTAFLVKDPHGKPLGLGATIKDLSEHKLGETISQLLSSLVESSEDAILSKKLDGTIMTWNKGAESLYGYTAKEAIGEPVSFLIPPEASETMEDILGKLKSGARVFRLETIRRKKDGSLVDVSLVISPIKDKKGVVVGASSIGRDISDRKKREDALKKANEDLQRLSRMKTEFASVISHELRTPLAAVKHSLEIILRGIDGEVTDQQRETLDIAANNAYRLERLIQNILDYSKLELGQLQFFFEQADLSKLLRETVSLVRRLVSSKGIHLQLASPKEKVMVCCDRDKLQEVVLNLIDNAVKYTGQGGTVRVNLTHVDGHVQIEVMDTGMGIKVEERNKIFKMYGQGERATIQSGSGSGIGLAVCKYVIEQHQGHIHLESAFGKGSRFIIRFPDTLPPGRRSVDGGFSLLKETK